MSYTQPGSPASHPDNVFLDRSSTLTPEESRTIAIERRLTSSSLPSIFPLRSKSDTSIRIKEEVRRRTSQTDLVANSHGDIEAGGDVGSNTYTEHSASLDDLAAKFGTSIDSTRPSASPGLSTSQAEKLLTKNGPNVLTPPDKLPLWLLFLLQFTNFFMVLLMFAGALTIALYIADPSQSLNLYLGLILFVVVFITCYETYSQEAKADNLMEKFRAMVPQKATVLRDGISKEVPAENLVCGDIIRILNGSKIPADCRILANEFMKVDQSMITGESEPVEVTVEPANMNNALEAKNLIFSGSLVVDGSCYAIVVRTGDNTLMGSMVQVTGDVGNETSTLKADIERFVKTLTVFALCQAIVIFAVGISRGLDPITVFVQGFVVIMVANVPQGLPSTVVALLLIVAERMGKENVFVKKLDIIETLGACSCICTDKTGTLTLNLMTVTHLWSFDKTLTSTINCPMPTELPPCTDESAGKPRSAWEWLLNIAILNSRVHMERKGDGDVQNAELEPVGDATEMGLYNFSFKNRSAVTSAPSPAGSSTNIHTKMAFSRKSWLEAYRESFPKLYEIPFNSSNKWQATLHEFSNVSTTGSNGAKKEVLLLKGAPDVIIRKCQYYLDKNGVACEINDVFMETYNTQYNTFGGNGERVLGFAFRVMPKTIAEELAAEPAYKERLRARLVGKNEAVDPIHDFIFVGLITLVDPARPEVPKAIADCNAAGIQVVMVTGDHPITAQAIAKNIGLLTHPTKDELAAQRGVQPHEVSESDVKAMVVHGDAIGRMSEFDWNELLKKPNVVFARTSPEQKLIIVKKFRGAGHIVAMTGDGVNDSPALKQSHIGIAMGKNGSDVAREAADLVLLDDNFASIVVGIREGRLLFANLKKSIAYTLAHLAPEVIPTLIWAMVGFPNPMGAIAVLFIDLGTEMAPAMAMAFEQAESSIMLTPPRNPKTDRLTSFPMLFYSYGIVGLIITASCLLVYFRTLRHYGLESGEVMEMNSKYFPSPSDNKTYKSRSGRLYSPNDQDHILSVIQASWFMCIVIGQIGHSFLVRSNRMSIFEHGFFANKYINAAFVVSSVLACFLIYTPGPKYLLNAADPLSRELFYGFEMSFFGILVISEISKWWVRSFPDTLVAKLLGW